MTTTGQIADAIEEISGDHLPVNALMGPGVDLHLYNATQSDLKLLDETKVIFYKKLHFERQILDIFEQ